MSFDLENRDWKEFKISDILNLKRGRRLKAKDRKKGDLAYYSATNTNNGLTDFISNPLFIEKNKVIVTTFCDSYFVEGDFTASDEITMLSNESVNKYSGKFISRIISSNQSKYAFGRKAFSERLEKQLIILPVNSKNEPDYEFMEQYMQHKEQEKQKEYQYYIKRRLKELKNTPKTVELNEKEWGEFFIEEIAEIISGKDIYARERIEGNTPYVSATANQNGIGYFVGNDNKTLESNCLSVNRNGSVGYSFYHPYKALFGNDCRKLRLNNSKKHIGLFISNQITRQKGKYGYGYKMGTARLKRQKIMLPINENNKPDYEFMENYMKNVEDKKLNAYLDFKKN